MCNPALAAVAVSAIGAAYSGYAQSQQADNQKKAAEQQLQLQQNAIDTQNHQLAAKAATAMSDRAKQARREQAALRVSSGESGVAGLSVSSLLNNVYTQQGLDNARTKRNLDNQYKKNSLDLQGFQLNAQNRIIQANAQKRDALISSGLQIASTGVGYYSASSAAKGK